MKFIHPLNIRWLLSALVLAVLPAMLRAEPAAAPGKPNIVYILADDLGWTDTGTYGSKYYETPNIDKLATQGLKLTCYHITDNAPLRSGKGSLYEGGTRDPFIVRWSGVTKPGTTCGVPTIHVDVYPTLLEIAAAPRPDQPLDGESLVPLFKDAKASLKRTAIFQHFPGYLGSGPGLWRTTPVGTIQAGDWKLLEFFEDNHLELYNLKEDIGEKNNLAEKMPDIAKELHAQMQAWREGIHARMPTKNHADGETKDKTRRNKQGDKP